MNILTKKRLFLKFQLIQILLFQVMHGYVHWYCSIDYCIEFKSLIDETMQKMALIS